MGSRCVFFLSRRRCRFPIIPLIPLPDVVPRPRMPLRHFLPVPLRSFPLTSAGTVRRVGRPTVAAYPCLNPPSPLVRVFNCPRHRTARRRSLDRSWAAPIVFSSVAPLGTSWNFSTASDSSGVGSFFSRKARVFTGQASVVSDKAFIFSRHTSVASRKASVKALIVSFWLLLI
jgi:hypothetical protein